MKQGILRSLRVFLIVAFAMSAASFYAHVSAHGDHSEMFAAEQSPSGHDHSHNGDAGICCESGISVCATFLAAMPQASFYAPPYSSVGFLPIDRITSGRGEQPEIRPPILLS
ncbi:MAG: hypothetical protein RIM33_15200 [Alphaproteobacteria bacterium]